MEQAVLLLDDNTKLLEFAYMEWEKHKIELCVVKSIPEAIREMQKREYSLIKIVADHVQPALIDSVEIMRSLSEIPILVLASIYVPSDKVASLKIGADEYLPMPDTIEEVVITGMALIRRYHEFNKYVKPTPKTMEYNGLQVCVDIRTVYVSSIEVDLTPREFDILCMLVENKQRVLTYGRILETLWGTDYIDNTSRIVTNMVSKLRNKLKVTDDTPNYIKNIHGVGYKFIAE